MLAGPKLLMKVTEVASLQPLPLKRCATTCKISGTVAFGHFHRINMKHNVIIIDLFLNFYRVVSFCVEGSQHMKHAEI